jgi:hypothetical protein
MLLRYSMSENDMVSFSPVITGITFDLTFHIH